MEYVLGIDIGTSGCKCVLLDGQGNAILSKGKEYNPIIKADGTVEQDPSEWYEAVVFCLKAFENEDNIVLKDIIAVCVTGQMQGVTLLDKHGETVRKSIIWNDMRAASDCDKLNEKFKKIFIRDIGYPCVASLTVSKIAWVQRNEPGNWAKTDKFLQASNYINYKLTGRISTDEHNITLSGLNDVKNNSWSKDLIDASEIENSKVPELTGCFDIIGKITKSAADETGLQEGVPVVAGGGDAGAENYSSGIAGKEQMVMRLGSAGCIGYVFDVEKVRHLDVWPGSRDVMRGYLSAGTYTKACAASVKWVRSVFFSDKPDEGDTYTFMDKEASDVPLGSEGLLYHPYLSGENAPFADSSIRGMFHGLNAGHRRKHFLRAVYEGVSFSMHHAVQSFEMLKEVQEVVFLGGGTKSKVWMSILPDILGKSGIIPEYCDAAYGAALMAAQGANILDARAKIQSNMKTSKKVSFNPENHEKYKKLYERYLEYAVK